VCRISERRLVESPSVRGHVAVIASACALGLALAAPAAAENRYELAGGCYELRSEGRTVAREAGPFRMQATALGRYLFYGKRRDFLAGGSQDRVESAPRASEAADWRIDEAPGGGFRITLPSVERR
jgi:hypothetical protein